MGGNDLRLVHVAGVVAHAACAGAWAAARNAGEPTLLAFPEGSEHTHTLRAQNAVIFAVAWSAVTALGRVAWRRDWLDAADSVVAWTALAIALGALLGFKSLELIIAFAGLECAAAICVALWTQPARRKPALVRSAVVAGTAHAAASSLSIGRAFAAQPSAVGAACVFSLAVAAAAAVTYAMDGGGPDGTIGGFESNARAAAQLATRVGVFFAFQSAALRGAGTASPYGIPGETLEVVAPLACAALFGIWFLFSYPEKVEKPAYDGPIGSLRGGREEPSPWAPPSRDNGGPRAMALSPLHTFPQAAPPPPSKKKNKGDLLPTAAPPPPRPQASQVSFHFTL